MAYNSGGKASSWAENTHESKTHCYPSKPGKFDFGFMGSDVDNDTPTPKSTQPAGTYPVASGKETPFAKPTHAPGTLKP